MQVRHCLWHAVAAQYDLSPNIMQGVEGVKELFLGGFLASDKLYIVYQQDVHCSIARAEEVGCALANRLDDLVGEALGRHIGDMQPRAPRQMPDGMEQVCLAQPHVAIDKQRIVSLAWCGRHFLCRRIGQTVRCSNRERLKHISWVQLIDARWRVVGHVFMYRFHYRACGRYLFRRWLRRYSLLGQTHRSCIEGE